MKKCESPVFMGMMFVAKRGTFGIANLTSS